ncbi:unnamed protein product [Rotaria sp. Silwood2]|nr:unnamed protein product [Rotaria sp. Silwood2]
MDKENSDNLFNLLLDNDVNKLEPSLHTRKQRRWRNKQKDKLYCAQLSLSRLLTEQIKESNQYLSKINEDFEDDVAVNDPVFNDNILVHDILMDDTNANGTSAGGTLDDNIHVDGILDDDTHLDDTFDDDTHADGAFDDDTHADGTLDDDTLVNNTLVDNYILHDDDYNYSFNLNLNLVQSTEPFAEQEADEPLYTGAPVTFKSYHKQILEFGASVKLSESNMNKLLNLIGNALPIENKLLKSYKKILTIFETTSTFNEALKCRYCLATIDRTNSCSIICGQNNCQRRIGDVIEHITVNRSYGQLIEIIRRNKNLILNYPQLANNLLPGDIITGSIYQQKRKNLKALNDTYPITLMIHIDGFPLIHWTKKHTWLVTGSIAEIPPPLRENQLNMLLLSLWNGSIKPDADSLLKEICDTIKQTVIVDNIKFLVDVLLFKADLPARALATKHVNHNAYYSCLECDQEGVWCEESRVVMYPYIPNQMNRRSSSHFDFCAEQVNQQLCSGNCYGVKGVSPLRKIMDIPTQIDLDVMHLCFIGHCGFLLGKWEKMIVKQSWLSVNNNDEGEERQLSQEYSGPSYCDLQPVPFPPISQSTIYISHRDPLPSRERDPTFENHQTSNKSLPPVLHSATSNENNCAPLVTLAGSPAKRRRALASSFNAPLTAPPLRRRFDPTLQSTAASLMRNVAGGTTASTSKTATAATKSISETSQNVSGFNQTIKSIVTVCEETNQLIKELLKMGTEHTSLIRELVNSPRELQKITQQLSHTVHMQAKVLQTRQQNDIENVSIMLNGIDVTHVPRGASLNTTARALVRAAYGEMASYNDLAPGEFDILLGHIAYVHGLNAATVFADSQSVKNSLQQMKHDVKKHGQTASPIIQSTKRTSTTIENISGSHENSNEDDEL